MSAWRRCRRVKCVCLWAVDGQVCAERPATGEIGGCHSQRRRRTQVTRRVSRPSVLGPKRRTGASEAAASRSTEARSSPSAVARSPLPSAGGCSSRPKAIDHNRAARAGQLPLLQPPRRLSVSTESLARQHRQGLASCCQAATCRVRPGARRCSGVPAVFSWRPAPCGSSVCWLFLFFRLLSMELSVSGSSFAFLPVFASFE